MKIGIDYLQETVSRQMFDSLYALKQSQTPNTNYQTDLIIDEQTADGADIRILYSYMPRDLQGKNPEDYDFVFLCNNGESLDTSTPLIFDLYQKHSNVYLISNSYLHPTHALKDRMIWFCYNIPNCRDYWNRPFYPQFYEHQNKSTTIKRQNKMTVINGENRAWRHHAIQEILKQAPELVVKSSITTGNTIREMLYCFWGSDEDQKFRDWLNCTYPVQQGVVNNYYNRSICVGIDQRFGFIPPGYLILDEYYENLITVFTERSWLNNELCITEKGLKCFIAGSLPMPIGGCNINYLYNQLGFYTAWNLLPNDLKQYDSIENHHERYTELARAVAWLHKNINTFDQALVDRLVASNRLTFLNGCNGTDLLKLVELFGI